MWPLIGGIVGLLATLVLGVVVGNWSKIQNALNGKKIAVLGPREAGKTTLIKFLLQGKLSEEYVATSKPEKYSGKAYSLQDLELKIKDTTDVPGDIQSHDSWEQLYKEADLVLYLVDAKKLHDSDADYEKTVLTDMRHIGEWFDVRKENPPITFLVATHCDVISEYADQPENRRSKFIDLFWKKPVLSKLINLGRGSKHIKCVAGSLRGKDETERLVGDILRQVIL